MRKYVVGLLGLATLSLSACTPSQLEDWLEWHEQDPAAAEEFARNACDGPCEVEQPAETDNEAEAETAAPAAASGTVWDALAECESSGDWSINTGNGYYGGLQFSLSSWQAVGGSGYPHEHSRDEQIYRAELLLDEQGWGAWPACSAELGLR